MGMGAATSNNKNKKSKKSKGGNGKGMGGKKNGAAAFDVGASLTRLEKKYEELQMASAKAMHNDEDPSDSALASEMVVTVRASPSKSAGTADWVPVAQLCLQPHAEVSSEWVQAAVSLYCRELSQSATFGAKVFATVPRQDMQYAAETIESFNKHVYETVMENNSANGSTDNKGEAIASMTKGEAREILQVDTEVDQRGIKQAYRKKSFQWHPDRLESDLSSDEQEHAAHEYGRIQKAYETLCSGIRTEGSSWYASLGGRERTGFRVIDLMSRDKADDVLKKSKVQSAIAGLDRELIQTFVSRNQAGSISVP